MASLNPTPPADLVDREGRPYFLWDCDLTLAEFREELRHAGRARRAWLVGKLMRQAKPDDVFSFILRGWDIGVMAGPGGAAGVDVAGLARFRDDLVARLLREARPE